MQIIKSTISCAAAFGLATSFAGAATVALTNADFESGETAWDQDPAASVYVRHSNGSIQSNTLHMKSSGDNWAGQNMTVTTDGGNIDATSYGSYTVEFDYGYRSDATTNGDITMRVALWNTTTNTMLDSADFTITDPGQGPEAWTQTDFQLNLSYDETAQTAGDVLQLRFINTTDLPSGSADWSATALIDNVSVTAVPEPSSAALLGLGGLALILRRRK